MVKEVKGCSYGYGFIAENICFCSASLIALWLGSTLCLIRMNQRMKPCWEAFEILPWQSFYFEMRVYISYRFPLLCYGTCAKVWKFYNYFCTRMGLKLQYLVISFFRINDDLFHKKLVSRLYYISFFFFPFLSNSIMQKTLLSLLPFVWSYADDGGARVKKSAHFSLMPVSIITIWKTKNGTSFHRTFQLVTAQPLSPSRRELRAFPPIARCRVKLVLLSGNKTKSHGSLPKLQKGMTPTPCGCNTYNTSYSTFLMITSSARAKDVKNFGRNGIVVRLARNITRRTRKSNSDTSRRELAWVGNGQRDETDAWSRPAGLRITSHSFPIYDDPVFAVSSPLAESQAKSVGAHFRNHNNIPIQRWTRWRTPCVDRLFFPGRRRVVCRECAGVSADTTYIFVLYGTLKAVSHIIPLQGQNKSKENNDNNNC
ncbi:hypothetical protein VP01_2113g1 [Puccinia sorghi]|uniref:Uncharacterized protein n=1 Tax=Puccinia sorghi TaxID=27349 RepID=A0A0L6VA19_9BASI|nr:hypothetical protein VP01_2113g1 [Puccinia sorghi]